MNRSPISPLNKALYERLKSGLVVAVYDYVPLGKKTPYIVLTDTSAQNWSTKTLAGAVVTATIKIFSEYQGDKEAAELADAVIALLKMPLELLDDWQVILFKVDGHSVERLETHREATITLKITMIDTKE